MRQVGRMSQGYFRCQDSVVVSISKLFELPKSGIITVLDAGAGEGLALCTMREQWDLRYAATVKLFGVESEKLRAAECHKRFAETGGHCIWAEIETVNPGSQASLVWANPSFDTVRGNGRNETAIFGRISDWTHRGGYLVLIVPDYVLSSYTEGLDTAIQTAYEFVGLWRFPEPYYDDFNQCLLVARRRERALAGYVARPAWSRNPEQWPTLPDDPKPVAQLKSFLPDLHLRRTTLGSAQILDAASRSPIRSVLLREALLPSSKIEAPLLPLSNGHLALALASGMCDGLITRDGVTFALKGSSDVRNVKVAEKDKLDNEGNVVATIDVFRFQYSLKIRCLLENGTIEEFSSQEGEPVTETKSSKDADDEE